MICKKLLTLTAMQSIVSDSMPIVDAHAINNPTATTTTATTTKRIKSKDESETLSDSDATIRNNQQSDKRKSKSESVIKKKIIVMVTPGLKALEISNLPQWSDRAKRDTDLPITWRHNSLCLFLSHLRSTWIQWRGNTPPRLSCWLTVMWQGRPSVPHGQEPRHIPPHATCMPSVGGGYRPLGFPFSPASSAPSVATVGRNLNSEDINSRQIFRKFIFFFRFLFIFHDHSSTPFQFRVPNRCQKWSKSDDNPGIILDGLGHLTGRSSACFARWLNRG